MTTTIRAFIVISAVLHIGAVAALYDPLPDAGSASPSLRVSIVRTQPETASDSAKAAAAPSPQKEASVTKSELAVAPKPAPAKAQPVKPVKAAVTNRSAANGKPDNDRSDTLRNIPRVNTDKGEQMFVSIQKPSARQTDEAGNVLRRLFTAHFNYPPLARRKGWQGEVRLGLRLESDGRLTHIRIVQSSGFAVLDNSAIKTARKVERVPDAARWLRGEWFDMVLPVQYQLNGS